MSWISRLFGSGGKSTARLQEARGWNIPVVGVSNYQQAIEDAYWRCEDGDPKVEAQLVPEPRNRHDPNAVMVVIDGQLVGYLAREMAVEYKDALGGLSGFCSAKIIGGLEQIDGRQASFGVRLGLAWPPATVNSP